MAKTLLKLTNQNYHSKEANQDYMSVSQYKEFKKCEAAALAKVKGEWYEPPTEAMLVGSYVDAWLEGTLDEFKMENPQIFTRKGDLYAQYKHADTMIKALSEDEFCMFALQGEKQVIMTAEMYGTPWKVKFDVYNPDAGRLVDLKTARSLREKIWNDELGYCTFVEAYEYVLQLAVYVEIERIVTGRKEWLEPLIVAVSKEDPPDKAIINFDEARLLIELEEIEKLLPHILAVKHGHIEPERCGKCAYCRSTKKVDKIVHFTELIG